MKQLIKKLYDKLTQPKIPSEVGNLAYIKLDAVFNKKIHGGVYSEIDRSLGRTIWSLLHTPAVNLSQQIGKSIYIQICREEYERSKY